MFVVGSYALAERHKARKRRVPRAPRAASEALRTATER
ncbi:MAG: hypothetical protein AVDCRST_MAG86-2238 [uncultured Truepera sp.]|uniref:Uncharacterized protein n=1 Tax=uncultured Truepera sp. TaxID=543023 RepID=A0A6J4VI23_9DEIN|nr:MAG: hypothetical protein AVDCRST_MAG86-2238 [uncultured Truepera sp.]